MGLEPMSTETEADGDSIDRSLGTPLGSECGTVVELSGRYLVDDPDRLRTTASGDFCSHKSKYTIEVAGLEIAVCETHSKNLEGSVGYILL